MSQFSSAQSFNIVLFDPTKSKDILFTVENIIFPCLRGCIAFLELEPLQTGSVLRHKREKLNLKAVAPHWC